MAEGRGLPCLEAKSIVSTSLLAGSVIEEGPHNFGGRRVPGKGGEFDCGLDRIR